MKAKTETPEALEKLKAAAEMLDAPRIPKNTGKITCFFCKGAGCRLCGERGYNRTVK